MPIDAHRPARLTLALTALVFTGCGLIAGLGDYASGPSVSIDAAADSITSDASTDTPNAPRDAGHDAADVQVTDADADADSDADNLVDAGNPQDSEASCAPLYNVCGTSLPCCTGTFCDTNGVCRACRGTLLPCQTAANCCSGHCSANFVCCLPAGNECLSGNDCCSSSCIGGSCTN